MNNRDLENSQHGDITALGLIQIVKNNGYHNLPKDQDLLDTSLGKLLSLTKNTEYSLEESELKNITNNIEDVTGEMYKLADISSEKIEENEKKRDAFLNKSETFHENSDKELQKYIKQIEHQLDTLFNNVKSYDNSQRKNLVAEISQSIEEIDEYFAENDDYYKTIIQNEYTSPDLADISNRESVINNLRSFCDYMNSESFSLNDETYEKIDLTQQSIDNIHKKVATQEKKQIEEAESIALKNYQLQHSNIVDIAAELDRSLPILSDSGVRLGFNESIFSKLDNAKDILNNPNTKDSIEQIKETLIQGKYRSIVKKLQDIQEITCGELEIISENNFANILKEYFPNLTTLNLRKDDKQTDINVPYLKGLYNTLQGLKSTGREDLKINVKDSMLDEFFQYNQLYKNNPYLTVSEALKIFSKLEIPAQETKDDIDNPIKIYYNLVAEEINIPYSYVQSNDNKAAITQLLNSYKNLKVVNFTKNMHLELFKTALDSIKGDVTIIINDDFKNQYNLQKTQATQKWYNNILHNRQYGNSIDDFKLQNTKYDNDLTFDNSDDLSFTDASENTYVYHTKQEEKGRYENEKQKLLADPSLSENAKAIAESDEYQKLRYTFNENYNQLMSLKKKPTKKTSKKSPLTEAELEERVERKALKYKLLSSFRDELETLRMDLKPRILPEDKDTSNRSIFDEAFKELLDKDNILESELYDAVINWYNYYNKFNLYFSSTTTEDIKLTIKNDLLWSKDAIAELAFNINRSEIMSKSDFHGDKDMRTHEAKRYRGLHKHTMINTCNRIDDLIFILDKKEHEKFTDSLNELISQARKFDIANPTLKGQKMLQKSWEKFKKITSDHITSLSPDNHKETLNKLLSSANNSVEFLLSPKEDQKIYIAHKGIIKVRSILDKAIEHREEFLNNYKELLNKLHTNKSKYTSMLIDTSVVENLNYLEMFCDVMKKNKNLEQTLLDSNNYLVNIKNSLNQELGKNQKKKYNNNEYKKFDLNKTIQLELLRIFMLKMNPQIFTANGREYDSLEEFTKKYPNLTKMGDIYKNLDEIQKIISKDYNTRSYVIDRKGEVSRKKINIIDVITSSTYNIDIEKLLKDSKHKSLIQDPLYSINVKKGEFYDEIIDEIKFKKGNISMQFADEEATKLVFDHLISIRDELNKKKSSKPLTLSNLFKLKSINNIDNVKNSTDLTHEQIDQLYKKLLEEKCLSPKRDWLTEKCIDNPQRNVNKILSKFISTFVYSKNSDKDEEKKINNISQALIGHFKEQCEKLYGQSVITNPSDEKKQEIHHIIMDINKLLSKDTKSKVPLPLIEKLLDLTDYFACNLLPTISEEKTYGEKIITACTELFRDNLKKRGVVKSSHSTRSDISR